MSDIDVLVIGAGTAGQTAAYDLIAEGYSVTVVEKSDKPGGVCALYGCQPKKWFYELTELMARSSHLKTRGIKKEPEVDWQAVLKAKNSFTSTVPKNTIANLQGNGIKYLEGDATFTGPGTVAVGAATYKPRFVIIATGAAPMVLPIEGSQLLATSNDFLDLKQLPSRLVFIGGGFISFEFAHFAARLGTGKQKVQILEVMDRPLGPFDADMVSQLIKAGQADGVEVQTGVKIERIRRDGEAFAIELQSGESIQTDLAIHGAGRSPQLETLNLDAAGISYSSKGIEVDENMRSSNKKVFAVGDCAATLQLARVADFEAHIAAGTIIAGETQDSAPTIDYRAAPSVLFTYPQLGMVGKTEQQLQKEGVKYWKSMDTEISWPTYQRIGLKHAAYKILVDDDGQFLGAHILSDNATGLINTFKHAMLSGMSVNQLYQESIMTPYPSRESDIIYMLEPLCD